MASELNHHVGYSHENECWFVRFYPYQTEQQAIEAIAEFSRPTPVAPVSPDAAFIEAARWHEAEAERKRSVAVKSKRLEAQIATHEASAAHFRSAVPVSPDATGKCGELETVGYATAQGENYATGCYLLPGVKLYGMEAVVTRSQAVELLAAERAEKEIAERNRDAARENFLTMQKTAAKLLERAEKAEADNAALVHDLNRIKDHETELVNDNAAAVKALEGLREKGRKVLDVLKAWEDDGDLVNSGKIVSEFRAVLGGKPSC